MIIAKSILIMCLLQLSFVAVDADNVKCTYNSLISNFNRKVHEDGSKFYYECDERTSYYVEKMCAVDESFDVKKLVRIMNAKRRKGEIDFFFRLIISII